MTFEYIQFIFGIASMIVGIYFVIQGIKWQRIAKKYEVIIHNYEPKVKQLMSILGTEGGESKQRVKVTKDQVEARAKIAQQLREHPMSMGMLKGLSDNEVFAMLMDEKFIIGLGRIGGILAQGIGGLSSVIQSARKEHGSEIGLAS
jgi:hypothetical protein